MLYYLGKGTVFKKEDCKEYKTKDGAVKAMAKTEDSVVWDENGQVVASVAAVTEEAEQETTQDDAETVQNETNEGKTENEPSETENAENEANTEAEKTIVTPQGKMKVTVICDGSLNLRRSAAWGSENICGRATRGQSYFVKEVHEVDGKKMVRTIDDLYLSGASEHVQFEQI